VTLVTGSGKSRPAHQTSDIRRSVDDELQRLGVSLLPCRNPGRFELDASQISALGAAGLTEAQPAALSATGGGGGGCDIGRSERLRTGATPLSWNAFQASVRGQGFSREEVRRMYREQKL
jgi:hypothetical protein